MRLSILFIGWLSMGLWVIASLSIAITLLRTAYLGTVLASAAVAFLASAIITGAMLVIFVHVRRR